MSRAEARRVAALGTLDEARQASLGQFFTPARAAELIASMATLPRGGIVRILVPGAGAGSLTAALMARLLDESPGVGIDERVVPFLAETLDDCKQTAARCGAHVTSQVVVGDFIAGSTGLLGRIPALEGPLDVVVMNPPYAKLGLSSAHRQALQVEGVDCPNLYAAFLERGNRRDGLARGHRSGRLHWDVVHLHGQRNRLTVRTAQPGRFGVLLEERRQPQHRRRV